MLWACSLVLVAAMGGERTRESGSERDPAHPWVLVVDAQGRPAVGASVDLYARASRDWQPGVRNCAIPLATTLLGHTLEFELERYPLGVTDGDGRLRVGTDRRGWLVASTGHEWGFGLLSIEVASPARVVVLPDHDLEVRVVDPRGSPCANVPVSLYSNDLDRWKYAGAIAQLTVRSGRDGVARFPHAPTLLADLFGPSPGDRGGAWVYPGTLASTHVGAFLHPGVPRETPLELVVPDSGFTTEVRFTYSDGAPILDPIEVELQVRAERRRIDAHAPERGHELDRAARFRVEGGVLELPRSEPGRLATLDVRFGQEGRGAWWMQLASPLEAGGAPIECRVGWPSAPTAVVRLLDETGMPLGDRDVEVVLRHGYRGYPFDARSRADGTLGLRLPASYGADGERVELRLRREDGRVERRGSIAIEPGVDGSVSRLGDVLLDPLEIPQVGAAARGPGAEADVVHVEGSLLGATGIATQQLFVFAEGGRSPTAWYAATGNVDRSGTFRARWTRGQPPVLHVAAGTRSARESWPLVRFTPPPEGHVGLWRPLELQGLRWLGGRRAYEVAITDGEGAVLPDVEVRRLDREPRRDLLSEDAGYLVFYAGEEEVPIAVEAYPRPPLRLTLEPGTHRIALDDPHWIDVPMTNDPPELPAGARLGAEISVEGPFGSRTWAVDFHGEAPRVPVPGPGEFELAWMLSDVSERCPGYRDWETLWTGGVPLLVEGDPPANVAAVAYPAEGYAEAFEELELGFERAEAYLPPHDE